MKSGRNIIVFGGSVLIAINFASGIAYGRIAGMPWMETLMIAGLLSLSSSAIVAKVLVDLKRTANPETQLILGLILFDDLFLALFLSTMSGILLAGSASVSGILASILISLGYMLLFFVIARKGTPFINRWLNMKSNEIFIIVIFALLFVVAGFSELLHVAEGIGALLLGLVFLGNGTSRSDRASGHSVQGFLWGRVFLWIWAEYRSFGLV
jgi:CPA2 family monovalent cation:H+ antiporter-2